MCVIYHQRGTIDMILTINFDEKSDGWVLCVCVGQSLVTSSSYCAPFLLTDKNVFPMKFGIV